MDYIITISESQDYIPMTLDWTSTSSYQINFTYTYNI